MQQPTLPVVGPVLLACLAALSCLTYATGTVTITRSEFTWTAERSGPAVPLVLSAQSPESLSASGPCSAAATAQAVDLLTTGDPGQNALTVRAQDGRVWMTYAGLQVGDVLAVPADCTLSIDYKRSDNTAVLVAGTAKTSAELVPVTVGYEQPSYRQFAMTRLGAAPAFTATVTTQPTTFSSSAWRLVWLLACAGSLVALGVLLKRRYRYTPIESGTRRWVAPDTLVAVVGTVALVVVPPRFDDGWVLTTVRHYNDLGFFSNYYSIDAAAQPQGFWWTWVERLWLDQLWSPGFLLRLPTVIILVGTWWLLRRYVLDPAGVRGAALWSAATVACAGLVGLQVTIRPEPMVALLLAATIAVVVRYARSREPFLLAVLGGLSALAISAHQTGWCVITASAAVVPWAWGWLRQPRNAVVAAAAAVCSVSLALILAMLGSNATLWWRSIRFFSQDTTTYQSLLNEGARLTALARFDNPSVSVAAVGLIILAGLGFLLRSERGDAVVLAAGWASIAGIAGLFLTTSKLVDHYGAVVPAAVVLTGLAVKDLRRTVAAGAIVAFAALGAVSFGRTGVWALGLERVTSLNLGDWPAVVLLLQMLVAATGLLALTLRRWQSSGLVTVSLASLAILSLLLSLAPVVAEGLRQPGSWFGQQVAVLRGQTCGLLDAVNVREPAPSVFDTPESSLTGGRTALLRRPSAWVRGSIFGPIQVEVLAGGSVNRVILPPSYEVWSLVPFSGTAQTGAVGWTDPVLQVVGASDVRERPAIEVARADRDSWWVEPGLALQAPCITSVSIRSGTVGQVPHSVGRPGWMGSGLLPAATQVYEGGCAGDDGPTQGRCLVTMVRGSGGRLVQGEMLEPIS